VTEPLILRDLRHGWTLELPIPPSANNLFPTGKNGKRFKSKEYAAWQEAAGWELKAQWSARPRHVQPIAGKFTIACDFGRFADKRRRDLGNREKGVMDLLVTHGVIADDSLAEEMTLRWCDDIAQGRVRCYIAEVLACK
jgi:Holliday junction resolvase RusA-like endonuclease